MIIKSKRPIFGGLRQDDNIHIIDLSSVESSLRQNLGQRFSKEKIATDWRSSVMYAQTGAHTQLLGDTSTAQRRKGVSAARRRGVKSPSGVRSTIRRIAPIVTIPRASESEEPAARKRKRKKKKKDGEKARAMFHVSRHEQSSASDVAGTLGLSRIAPASIVQRVFINRSPSRTGTCSGILATSSTVRQARRRLLRKRHQRHAR